jgi:lipopolysaccharide transport system permease protein
MPKSGNSDQPTKIIKPGSSSVSEYLLEIWKYKNLIMIFTVQEIKVQYIQTHFNFLWIILRPLTVLALFTFIFDRLIHIPGLSYPYTIFAFSGLIVWNNFSFMVNSAGNVILSNQQLVKKIYFPRIILLLSKTIFGLIEVFVSVILLLILIVLLRYPIHWQIFFFLFLY